LLFDEHSQQAIEVAERFADGQASRSELLEAQRSAFEVARQASLHQVVTDPGWAAARLAARVVAADAMTAAGDMLFLGRLCFAPWRRNPQGGWIDRGDEQIKRQLGQQQADLLREILGNIFRPVVLDPVWLRNNESAVYRLACDIYDEKRWEEMPILADALEEAGCTDHTLLQHCRRPVGHTRGCWALDLLLQRH